MNCRNLYTFMCVGYFKLVRLNSVYQVIKVFLTRAKKRCDHPSSALVHVQYRSYHHVIKVWKEKFTLCWSCTQMDIPRAAEVTQVSFGSVILFILQLLLKVYLHLLCICIIKTNNLLLHEKCLLIRLKLNSCTPSIINYQH